MNFLDDAPIPHFVLVPYMAQGHTIPMIDMAHVLARHGALVSFITTPANAKRIESTIDRARALNLPIQFVPLKLCCAAVGLPDGCESADKVLDREQLKKLTDAYGMLQEPLKLYLRAQNNLPSCIISDLCQPWTGDVARDLGIPRLMFNGFCAFSSLCRYNTALFSRYPSFLAPRVSGRNFVEVIILQVYNPSREGICKRS
jgi:hypothetical protein